MNKETKKIITVGAVVPDNIQSTNPLRERLEEEDVYLITNPYKEFLDKPEYKDYCDISGYKDGRAKRRDRRKGHSYFYKPRKNTIIKKIKYSTITNKRKDPRYCKHCKNIIEQREHYVEVKASEGYLFKKIASVHISCIDDYTNKNSSN